MLLSLCWRGKELLRGGEKGRGRERREMGVEKMKDELKKEKE